jgi:hypothetical protein
VLQFPDEQDEQLPPPDAVGFCTVPATPNTESNLIRLRDLHFGQLASSSSDFLKTRNSNTLPQSLH